ncbi:helix-turn-helix domain containing protein [Microbacterium sp. STN6]|uniref:TetR/AcrR family transcriptional regulator n=1 Tax=Microbacterium sp. STN6 TaxID=2995588 RepID=UPI002260A210|nr:helix-turn-helix domain-containing protein [Microbacterium sp. STN6]MCX7520933.1 helix-turn-helix domain containing protein [Microbacterium sp. STN6]
MEAVTEELGLRERKRRATRLAIQRAAIDLASERGLEGVTVEEISRVANVSPRTFFNYFSSKDTAVVGEVPELPDEAAIERFVNAGPAEPLLDGIAELLAQALLADDPSSDEAEPEHAHDQALHDRRRELLRLHPQLFALKFASMREFETRLETVVERRLVADRPALAAKPDELRSRALMATYVAFAGVRHAWSCWADRGGRDSLVVRLRESFALLASLSTPAT